MGARSIVVDLRGGDLAVVVGCWGAARDLARVVGFDPVDQTRIATAVLEIVRNAVQYANSVSLTLRQVEAPGRRGLEVIVEDRGPGIADLERVLRGGYSTSGGLGPGIAGARQLMDEFEIESAPSRGTRVRMCKWLPLPQAPVRAQQEGETGAFDVSPDGLEAKLHVERRPGTRCVLAHQPPTSDLTLVAMHAETVPPPPVSREKLMTALQAAGVVYGIDELALGAAQTSTESGSLVVARGLPPIPPGDGRVEPHFEDAPYVPAEVSEEATRVDLLSLHRVSTVAPGALLATKHPPRPGHPGRKVTGESMAVARPRDVALRAGPGALLDEEGLRVYAARDGRPTCHRGVVAVLPLHPAYGDVGSETGHIAFDGDVLVTGNVNESMRVESGGRVMVGGIVSGAEIRAEEGVAGGHGVVRSRVVAGGSATVALQLASAVRPVHRQLEQLVASVRFFKQQAPKTAGIASLGDRPIVRAVIERKFPGLPRLVEGLLPLAQQVALVGAEAFDELVGTL